jgi:hypothetical protein
LRVRGKKAELPLRQVEHLFAWQQQCKLGVRARGRGRSAIAAVIEELAAVPADFGAADVIRAHREPRFLRDDRVERAVGLAESVLAARIKDC